VPPVDQYSVIVKLFYALHSCKVGTRLPVKLF
jgi:hypothetical protein